MISIIAHGDADGVCSAAIALTHFIEKGYTSEELNLYFSQPYTLCEVLNEVPNAELLVVLDVSVNKKSVDKIINMYINGKFGNVVVIDHHESSLRFRCLFDGLIETNLSASQLTSMYFRVPSKLADYGAIADKFLLVQKQSEDYEQVELLRESLSYDTTDFDFKRSIAFALIFKKPSEIPELVRRANESVKHKNEILKIVEANVVHCHGFVFIDAREVEVSGVASSVAGTLSTKYRLPVFLLFRNKDTTVLCARAIREIDINLNEVVKTVGVGGGHKCAASCRVKNEMTVEKIIDTLDKAINKKVVV